MTLAAGSRLGTYEITAAIGAGGMGEVYRALDTRLGREVAIKVLPASESGDAAARERLVREAKTASRLNHPNICTVYDAGEAGDRVYIAMELVEGRTLSELLAEGPMPFDRVVRYGIQLADALAHAHQRRIIHRDLKSANIAITTDGRVKILDFGLAKMVDDDAGGTTRASLTGADAIVGTVAYMAPEVLRGAAADARSDLWSVGIVLFEMAAGRRPFTGGSVYELTSAILTSEAPPLPAGLPPGVAAVIGTALAKSSGERYQQAGEMRAALEAIAQSGSAVAHRTPSGAVLAVAATALVIATLALGVWWYSRSSASDAPHQIRALAVLPLTNLSGDASQDFFADGITEALITDLARIKGLDVISRTSTMQYRQTLKRLPEIARELTVEAVIQGSVMRSGDRVRVSAQLIDAVNDRHLWADEYDRDVRDVLVLQRDVARAIAREVRATLSPEEEAGLTGGRPIAPEAHDLYLKAKALTERFNEPSIAEAIRMCEAALRIDPEFAVAWAALASAHAERGIWGQPPSSRESGARARAAITRALALDPEDPEAVSILGLISMVYDWDWAGAERALNRSVELAAGRAQPRNLKTSLFMALRRFPEAIEEAERYRRLDPASPVAMSALARARYRAGQFEQAIADFNESIALDSGYGANYARLADVYIALGRYPEAIATLERGQRVFGDTRRQIDGFAVAYALAGRRAEAQALRRELVERSRNHDQAFYSLAMIDTALGDHDAAFAWLDRAYEARSANLWLVDGELKFDPLRKDPRFGALLRRMHLPGR